MVEIQLYEGLNDVVYTGPTQPVADAVASILPYLNSVWYWDEEAYDWLAWSPIVGGDLDTMVTGESYNITMEQDALWTYEEVAMPTRTAMASGTVHNDALANVDASFRVNLWTEIWDEAGVRVEAARVSTSVVTPVIAAGGSSLPLTITASKDLGPGWEMEAWVTLDRVSPSPATLIDSTDRTRHTEPIPDIYGGSLEDFVPTISARVEDLLGEIPGLAGIPGVARVT